MFLLRVIINFLWHISVLTNCLKVICENKICDTYYISNGYTNGTKVYGEYIEFGTGSNHKKHRKTKKLVFQRNR